MSSDEDEPSGPILPKDSDQGSSVSSELQDEYEELLRYAVVTPKLETSSRLQRLGTSHQSAEGPTSQRKDDADSLQPADFTTEAGQEKSNWSVESSHGFPLIVEPSPHSRASLAEELAAHTSGRASMVSDTRSEKLQTIRERSPQSSPDLSESVVTEMFISEENTRRMEDILDTWSSNLKSNVLMELQKWKLVFMERHKLEMKKEKEKHASQTTGLKSELDSLKELLQTFEISNQRKDEVIANLSQVLDRQKEKLEQMKAFTQWRLQHNEVKEEAVAAQRAQHHYNLQLKRKVWLGWSSLVQKHWKVKVEQACRTRAEEVCNRLSAEYEAKLTKHYEALEKAQAEIVRLRHERERYEESMKKAFMRGVCALNLEALHMLHSTEGRPGQPEHNEPLPSKEQSGSAPLTQPPSLPVSGIRLSPVHFDHEPPFQSEGNDMMNFSAPVSRTDVLPSTSVAHGSLPLGGTSSFNKQVSGRGVTINQHRHPKTITARITARPDSAKQSRSTFQVMGVAPPMSSVIVERHHPVTQLTIGQAMAAKFPRSSQQGPSSGGGRGSSRAQTSSCNMHSIKVVE